MTAEPGTHTVLLIDDNVELLRALERSLTLMSNMRVVTAQDGAEGLEQFFTVHPDCVVIDVRMPELDGYQLVRALRGDPASASTPLIILTAMAQERDRMAGLAAGSDIYLVKPVRPQDLMDAIEQALNVTDEQRLQRRQALLDDDSLPMGGEHGRRQ